MIPITEIIIPSKNPERIRAKTTFIVEESEFKKGSKFSGSSENIAITSIFLIPIFVTSRFIVSDWVISNISKKQDHFE